MVRGKESRVASPRMIEKESQSYLILFVRRLVRQQFKKRPNYQAEKYRIAVQKSERYLACGQSEAYQVFPAKIKSPTEINI